MKKHASKNKFPKGWDDNRVKRVLNHYEHQSDAEATLEYQNAWKDQAVTFMPIPHALLPKVRKLLAKKS